MRDHKTTLYGALFTQWQFTFGDNNLFNPLITCALMIVPIVCAVVLSVHPISATTLVVWTIAMVLRALTYVALMFFVHMTAREFGTYSRTADTATARFVRSVDDLAEKTLVFLAVSGLAYVSYFGTVLVPLEHGISGTLAHAVYGALMAYLMVAMIPLDVEASAFLSRLVGKKQGDRSIVVPESLMRKWYGG